MERPGFDEYVIARSPMLLRIAYLLCGDRHLAEDLVQEALIKVHRRWSAIEAENPDAYAKKVLLRTYLSWRERRSSSEVVTASAADALGTPGFDDEHASRDEVWALLATLPRAQRAVLVLRCFDDLDDRRIAELVGVSAAAVRVHAHRGLATLRQTLVQRAEEMPVAPGLAQAVRDGAQRAQRRRRAMTAAISAVAVVAFLAMLVPLLRSLTSAPPPIGPVPSDSASPSPSPATAEPPVPLRGCGWTGAGTPTAGTPPVVEAVIDGDIERLAGLLNDGVDPNTIDATLSSTPLSIAAQATCTAAVRLLLDAGADPNLIAEGGEAPLAFAANVGNIEVVTMLLAGGADPSQLGSNPEALPTPLHEAVGVGRAGVVRLMVPHVSDIDAGLLRDANPLAGEDIGVGSALEFAAGVEDREDYVRLLLEAGATPTITALYRAVQLGSAESVTLLLTAGAPMTISSNETRTMVQVALDFGHPDIALLLEQQ